MMCNLFVIFINIKAKKVRINKNINKSYRKKNRARFN
jgi:hypothetical protein